jgi:hypothetical protein
MARTFRLEQPLRPDFEIGAVERVVFLALWAAIREGADRSVIHRTEDGLSYDVEVAGSMRCEMKPPLALQGKIMDAVRALAEAGAVGIGALVLEAGELVIDVQVLVRCGDAGEEAHFTFTQRPRTLN